MKLTDQQKADLCIVYRDGSISAFNSIEAVCDAYLAMLQASKTHRVVEAPEGFEINTVQYWNAGPTFQASFQVSDCRVSFKPIPKPCPPPRLDPVTVTVEDIYGAKPKILEGHEAKFGKVCQLQKQGFSHFISVDPGNPVTLIQSNNASTRICLRKWGSA
jgi:hypothetical protein